MRAKVLATDFDRTFTRADGSPDPAAFEAARQLRSRGVRLVLATGRTVDALERMPGVLDAFDACVAEGGAMWGSPGAWRLTVADLGPLSRLAAALAAAGIATDRGRASLSVEAADAAALQALPEAKQVSARRNRDRVDVTPRGADKSVALRALLAAWGIDPAEVAAIGDGENDAELLASVGHGVAVANAVPALKAVAREVAPFEASQGFAWLAARIR